MAVMAERTTKRFTRVAHQSRLLRVWKDLAEWRDIYQIGPPEGSSRSLQALYAARATELDNMCKSIDQALHVLRLFV
jgi:hypothetical protein